MDRRPEGSSRAMAKRAPFEKEEAGECARRVRSRGLAACRPQKLAWRTCSREGVRVCEGPNMAGRGKATLKPTGRIVVVASQKGKLAQVAMGAGATGHHSGLGRRGRPCSSGGRLALPRGTEFSGCLALRLEDAIILRNSSWFVRCFPSLTPPTAAYLIALGKHGVSITGHPSMC